MERNTEYGGGYWIWDGGPTRADAERELTAMVKDEMRKLGWVGSPLKFEVLSPDSPFLAGPPPANIRGLNPVCILGLSKAVAPLPTKLDFPMTDEDRVRLRAITRRRWQLANPGEHLDDEACDAMIADFAPMVAAKVSARVQ